MTVWIRARIVNRSQRNPRGRTYAVLYRRGGRMYPVHNLGLYSLSQIPLVARAVPAVAAVECCPGGDWVVTR